jgi:signal transduction histidine kinase
VIRVRPAGLFWQLAVSFLLVIVLAILLQGAVVIGVIEPLARRAARERADTLLVTTAAEVAEAFARVDPEVRELRPGRLDREIAAILRMHRREAGPVLLQFRYADGRIVGAVTGPPRWRHMEAPPPGMSPPEERDPGNELQPRAASPRWQPLARRAVTAGLDTLGEVLALAPPRRLFFLPANVPGSILLFFPIAILLAGTAGFLTVRSLTRRLGLLESLAGRVAEGDLAARVPAPAGDEIGRLGGALNRMAERLAAARDRAAEGERQRTQLFADITHELATPLTSIRGYAETLLDSSVPLTAGEREEYLRNVLEEAKRLDLLVQDLFELNRMEAGALPLSPERLDWSELCRNTLRRFEPRFRGAGLTLRWVGPEDTAWVVADGRRMEQVLENLLMNALRYVPAGGTVSIALGRSGAPGAFRLSVSDDGPGIAVKDATLIFERFYRADEARASSGTGLGLAIVRQIVVQHGGTVRAEPGSPRGTTFIVELPPA